VRDVALALKEEGIAILLLDTNNANIAAARMSGLAAECVNVLSEPAQTELDMSGLGRLLAMTPNDEVNAMAARELTPLFGRANVYQLPAATDLSGNRWRLAEHIGGRTLFGKLLNYDEIDDRTSRGAVVKKTKLTAEFTWRDFRELYGPTTQLLFVFVGRNALHVCSTDQALEPKPGHVVVALVQSAPQSNPDDEAAIQG
jgi:CPA1 family monovalent cation:H+ antiporter